MVRPASTAPTHTSSRLSPRFSILLSGQVPKNGGQKKQQRRGCGGRVEGGRTPGGQMARDGRWRWKMEMAKKKGTKAKRKKKKKRTGKDNESKGVGIAEKE